MNETLKARLDRGFQLLTLIEERRRQTGDKTLGMAIEREIIGRELRDLEAEALPEPVLVVKKGRNRAK
jgi:hypothetical protein